MDYAPHHVSNVGRGDLRMSSFHFKLRHVCRIGRHSHYCDTPDCLWNHSPADPRFQVHFTVPGHRACIEQT